MGACRAPIDILAFLPLTAHYERFIVSFVVAMEVASCLANPRGCE
jgi:hypothetical protein